ncbi:non-canonical purine NTP diphosphatase [Tenuifilum osseticum]|uniref:non-canonical purine NTP diphosphatase n=1 Tax=Tenuifilum osseticum TaxID=3374723 RepID=UPI0034E494F0
MADSSFSLVFATNNPHKLKEVQHALGDKFTLVTLNAVGITEEIPEEYDTLQDNALQKARYVYNKTGQNCFADDTGLEVEALNWEPGVYSARYAGEAKNPKDNIRKLLSNLKGVENRKARFRTVIALILNGEEYLFEGVVWGKIIDQERGADGFGYDPIFVPDGFTETFAEMPLSLKNQISHRGKAVEELCKFLKRRF